MEIVYEKILKKKFDEFSKHESKEEQSYGITLRQLDKWLDQAEILDMNKITTTDTGMLFFKFQTATIDFQKFFQFVCHLVSGSGNNLEDTLKKLESCGEPMDVDIIDNNPSGILTFRSTTTQLLEQKYLKDF